MLRSHIIEEESGLTWRFQVAGQVVYLTVSCPGWQHRQELTHQQAMKLWAALVDQTA